MQSKFKHTPYAQMSALISAKAFYQAADSAAAKTQLQWAIEHARDTEYQHLARLRLASILLDEKAYDQGLSLLAQPPMDTFKALYADRRGDLLAAQGKRDDARQAYQDALQWLATDNANHGPPIAFDDAVYAAGANGTVAKFDVGSGQTLWRTKLDTDLSAGVGSDGTAAAVASLNGTVYLLDANGKLLWQANANGEILTSPLVGQGKVLVRTTDSRIIAFDLQTGAQKWVFYNRAPLLNLRTSAEMIFAVTMGLRRIKAH
ncbi:hypothetical protein BGZ97_006315 [Linnemannia gamsii]|uniref:Ancillary SecYEG translocon subunit n=1 Tax=Linnemannia gamsii TaxID=64522 RepID=A0A9P6RPR0_9FUNG|nr:hypothetical protein BGZ97_006315 [Linnemannia gamsii]